MTDSRPAPYKILSLASLGREFLVHLPIWFVYLESVGLLHAALANYPDDGFAAIGASREVFIPTLAFPMVWVASYFAIRIRRSGRLDTPARRRWAWGAWVAMVFGLPAVVVFGYQPYPLTHDQLTTLYEFAQFLWVALFVAQILIARGFQWLVLFFGVTFVYGLILENTGIIMHFFYEPSFRLYLWGLPAPLCTMVGWCVVFYVTVDVIEKFAAWYPRVLAAPWKRALGATAVALCMDLQLDPLASMSGVFWHWNDALPREFLGVPFINWAAWFGAFLPFAWFLFRIFDRKDLSLPQKNWELFLRVPLAALLGGAICFGVMALWEGGFDGPSFEILEAFGKRLLPY